jgi:hypothetical protein
MPTLEVLPRPTPAERDLVEVQVDVDEDLAVFAETIEEWTAPHAFWEFSLREGTEFGRRNNVEGELLFVAGEQTSSLRFRLDQLDDVTATSDDLLVLRFEERDGIAKLARCTGNGLDIELFHILTFT